MIRVGQGIDIHPFETSRPLVLGGVRISQRDGLQGHSDADVVFHAITDALLGSIGEGDIGAYFPSSDDRWKGVSSERFIAEALTLLESKRGYVINVDVTIIAEKPKIAPFRDPIRESIASHLHIDYDRVSVKATTTDHLGFIGREEGICVMAIVLVEIQE